MIDLSIEGISKIYGEVLRELPLERDQK